MAGIWEYLSEVLLRLFARDPAETERRKQLRALYEQIRLVQPLYLRRPGMQLLPEFGRAVLQLALLLRPLRELFAKTVDNEDSRLAQRYRDHLLTARLPATYQEMIGSLGYGALKDRVLQAADPLSELEQAEGQLREVLAFLAQPELAGFDRDYAALERLNDLARHNFLPLLSLFDPSLRALGSADPASFRAVPGDRAMQELLDLHFVLEGCEVTPWVKDSFDVLLERLTRQSAEEAGQKAAKLLERLRALLGEKLRATTVLAMIRLIQRDPQAAPQPAKAPVAYLEAFRNRLIIEYHRNRERLQRLVGDLAVEEDLIRLLGTGELLPIEGYDEQLAQALQQREMEGFSHLKPMRILKSYIRLHFERELKERLKKLIVEGKFENKIFQNMFTNAFFNCETTMAKIESFEQTLTTAVKKLQKYLELLEQGKPVYSVVTGLLETIDEDSRRLVEEGANAFYNLCTLLKEILQDTQAKTPAHISNIKTLPGRRAQEYFNQLASGQGYLSVFARIIQNYAPITQLSSGAGREGH
jgi:hypothetical protein